MVEGSLEHSLAFSGMATNCDGGIYKNGATKVFEEKARVAQIFIEMNRTDLHNKPSTCALAKAAKVSRGVRRQDCERAGRGYLSIQKQ
jgi:hypothetical protein